MLVRIFPPSGVRGGQKHGRPIERKKDRQTDRQKENGTRRQGSREQGAGEDNWRAVERATEVKAVDGRERRAVQAPVQSRFSGVPKSNRADSGRLEAATKQFEACETRRRISTQVCADGVLLGRWFVLIPGFHPE